MKKLKIDMRETQGLFACTTAHGSQKVHISGIYTCIVLYLAYNWFIPNVKGSRGKILAVTETEVPVHTEFVMLTRDGPDTYT